MACDDLHRIKSSLSRHAGRPDIASVLVQNHRNDLSSRVAFEVELRVDNLEKELVLGAREDGEGRLPGDLCFEMVALEREIDYGSGIELVLADVATETTSGLHSSGGLVVHFRPDALPYGLKIS